MTEIGKINTLSVVRETANGLYLDAEELGEILMPTKFVTPEVKEEGKATVFVYTDSEDRLVATTEKPLAKVGDFACLRLFVPFSEQNAKMREGGEYWVYVYLDLLTNRVVASAKLHKFLDNTPPSYQVGDEVEVIILEETDLGFKAIVNEEHTGILYRNQVFSPLFPGMKTKAYIQKIRDDEKIDLLLEKPGYDKVDAISQRILTELKNNRGFLAVSDKSSPEMIHSMFGISKKNFKKAVGALYKQRRIDFHSDGIRLLD